MAYDKVVDSAVLDAGLKQIADAIREKAGTTDALAFPQAMADAIAAIQSGGEELVIEDFTSFFADNTRLELLGKIDLSNGVTFKNAFNNSTELETISMLDKGNGVDLSKSTSFSGTFRFCENLTSVPVIDTRNSSDFSYMFNGCKRLITIAGVDMGKGLVLSNVLYNCIELTNLYLYNIGRNLQIGSGTSWGHKLTVDSLVNTIKELVSVNASRTLTIGATNIAKIENLFCRITDDTNEKKTMELCESTDEGAMTLTEYATAKGWQIK